MTASPDLFNLIKSLTPSEKRYFKIFASRHVIGKKNNYEKFFDAMDELPEDKSYDEAEFKRSLKGKSWSKNFAVEKNLLEDLLLKALRSYHAEKTVEGQLGNMIANIQILYDKGLIQTAHKMVAKALEMANGHSKLSTVTTLYHYKLLLTRISPPAGEFYNVDADFEEDTRILKMLDTERRTYYLRRKISNLKTIVGKNAKSATAIEEGKKMIGELDGIMSSAAVTTQTKLNILIAKSLMLDEEGRYNEALDVSRNIIKIFEKKEGQLNEPSSSFRMVLANYLHNCLRLEHFEEFPAIIEKIEQLPSETIREKAEVFRISMHYRLLYYLNTQNNAGSKEMVTDLEKGLRKYEALIPKEKMIHFRFNICLLHLKQHNYNELINAINKAYMVTGRDEALKTNIRDLKFMEATAHLSLKNYDLVDYHLRNIERWLKENKLNNDFTNQLIKKLREMMRPGASQNLLGPLADLDCPDDLKMLREILVVWPPL